MFFGIKPAVKLTGATLTFKKELLIDEVINLPMLHQENISIETL